MLLIRKAGPPDLDFMVEIDLLGDGYTLDPLQPEMTLEERLAHREKIAAYGSTTQDGAPQAGGWIAQEDVTGTRVGLIMALFRDRPHEPDTEANRFLFQFLDASIFPSDGRFCEIFQLWVHPDYRRQGLATRLKNLLEVETKQRGMRMIYTHTEVSNQHVVEMNRKLGYQEVRRGPLWDAVPRVSLVKHLHP